MNRHIFFTTLSSIFLLCFCTVLNAQKEASNWYFGFNANVSFTSGTPVSVDTSSVYTVEGTCSISDRNGNLLMYTDGVTLYNRRHIIMQNGDSLFGHPSSTQSALIIPHPGNDSLFYVFTTDEYNGTRGLCYSLVNIQKANGLGAVVQKNIPLLKNFSEKLTAVFHCNQRDVWVITRENYSDRYYSWLITSGGLSGVPVISSTGVQMPLYTQQTTNFYLKGAEGLGYLKASPDGKKIVNANGYGDIEIGLFSNTTGKVSQLFRIDPSQKGRTNTFLTTPYGVEFSPFSRFLYTTSKISDNQSNRQDFFFQYDISIHDSATIQNSRVTIDSSGRDEFRFFGFPDGSLQLGIDGKIYGPHNFYHYLCVLTIPILKARIVGCNTTQYN